MNNLSVVDRRNGRRERSRGAECHGITGVGYGASIQRRCRRAPALGRERGRWARECSVASEGRAACGDTETESLNEPEPSKI